MRKTIAVLLVATVFAGLFYFFAAERAAAPQARQRLTIAVGQQPLSGLLFIAAERGFFDAEGLEVELRPYSHGKLATKAVADGAVDLATTAEMPFIAATRAGQGLVAIATIESSDQQNFIVARKDRGIERPRDLIGKRVGIIPGTSSEIFLGAFLITHGIAKTKLELAPYQIDTIATALESGAVDAVSAWALSTALLKQKLGSSVQVFDEEGLYVQNWLLVARRERAAAQQASIQKALRALIRAEDYAAENPQAAIDIVARSLGVDARLLSTIWPNFGFYVGLHQYLLINLENHARLSRSNEFERDQNFYSFLMLEPLLAVDSARVTAIH